MKDHVNKIVSDIKRSSSAKTLRYARGFTASVVHSFPANKMIMIGVTGTDGKTTTCNLVYHLLKSSGHKVGLVSTISAKIFNGDKEVEYDTGFHVTSPDSFSIQKYLKEMVSAGCTHAVIECTSHAFEQERYAGINFDIGVITNISHEHLDYHKTFERYVLAKSQLFRIDSSIPKKDVGIAKRVAVINQDDKAWELLKPYTSDWNVVGYGVSDFASFHIISAQFNSSGTDFIFQVEQPNGEPTEQYSVHSPLLGTYNVSNVVAAITAVSHLSIPINDLCGYIPSFPQLAGRFERFQTNEHGLVVVDFAHTPNGMEQILTLSRDITKGKIITLFGSAGLRDVEKRYLMGKIAGTLSHIAIVTAEDPRTESLDSIFELIERGLKEVGAENYPINEIDKLSEETIQSNLTEHFPLYIRIDDRATAIKTAINLAKNDDIVLILGKGHEKSMCFGSEETPWSDQEAVTTAVSALEH